MGAPTTCISLGFAAVGAHAFGAKMNRRLIGVNEFHFIPLFPKVHKIKNRKNRLLENASATGENSRDTENSLSKSDENLQAKDKEREEEEMKEDEEEELSIFSTSTRKKKKRDYLFLYVFLDGIEREKMFDYNLVVEKIRFIRNTRNL